jgi:hypothetical protein
MLSTDVRTTSAPRVEVVPAPVPVPIPPQRSAWPTVALVAAVVVGTGLRLLAFTVDRPLWIDEAMIALNLCDRSVGQMFEPLDRNQTAPVAFLLAGKLCVTVFGPTEHALRLPALVGSLLGLLAFSFAAVRLLPPGAARLAVWLFALSPTVVNYAAEVKQYSTDAAVTAGLLAVAAPLLRTPTRGRQIALGVCGTLAVWVAHPAVFVLAAIGAVLFVQSLMTKQHRLTVVLLGMAWLASFAGMYQVNARFGTANTYLADYWADFFMPRSLGAGPWLVERWVDFFRSAGGFGGEMLPAAGLAAVAAVVGVVMLWRDGRRAEVLVSAGVFAVTLFASLLGKYPFNGRVLLFLTPVGVLMAAHGTAAVAGAVWAKAKLAAVVIVAAMLVSPAAEVVRQLRHPDRAEDVPVVLRHIRERWQPGDRLYVYNGNTDVGAGPAFEFYTREARFPADAVVLGGEYRKDARGYQAEVNALAATPGRVWVLFSHQHADDEAWVRAYFDAVADRGEQFRDPELGRGPRAAVFAYTIR